MPVSPKPLWPLSILNPIPLSRRSKRTSLALKLRRVSKRVVNVSRHSITLFQDSCPLALLGRFIELNSERRLMSERLGKFDFFRAIRRSSSVTDANKSFHLPADQGWDRQELLGSYRSEILA